MRIIPHIKQVVSVTLLCLDLVLVAPAGAGFEPRSSSAPESQSPAILVTTTLSEDDLEELRSAILRRCALSSELERNKLPWYFFYEYGVALLDAGDAARGLEALQMGANLHKQPMRGKRMYGMWFVDYFPYFQIARAHAALGNWAQAREALALSDRLEKIVPGEYQFPQYSELKTEINAH